ncbi:ABC transporter ATP-binding protein, partial [Timonella senegalensis]|uniref:ABC transporter ATP-binding protein n=1 Tax=Timonella senegalensis TaxID=1465825 RepID=UPI0012B5B019
MLHLEIRGLSKNYGDLRALDDLSFSVGPSEIFGFVGSNGAGKSTTMRIALGVLEPTAGDVLLDGVPLNFESRRRIGYMPEERGLYPKMKVGDQLVYIAQLHGMPAAEAKASML